MINLSWVYRAWVLCVALCVGSGGALAAPITNYITVQPIDVCSAAAGMTNGLRPDQ